MINASSALSRLINATTSIPGGIVSCFGFAGCCWKLMIDQKRVDDIWHGCLVDQANNASKNYELLCQLCEQLTEQAIREISLPLIEKVVYVSGMVLFLGIAGSAVVRYGKMRDLIEQMGDLMQRAIQPMRASRITR